MSSSPDLLATVIAYGDAIARKDIDGALALFAPGATIVPGNVPNLPFGGTAHGEPALRRFITGMIQHIEIVSNDVDAVLVEVDTNTVAVFTKLTAQVNATGKKFVTGAVLRFTMNADGSILRYEVHEDTLAVTSAFTADPVPEIDRWTDSLHDGLQRGDIGALSELWGHNISYQGPALRLNGLEERITAERPVLAAFTNVNVEVHRRWRDGPTMIEQCTLHGDHTGNLDTPIGVIAPTGRRVHFDYLQVVTWSNGKVIDQLISYDRVELIEQLSPIIEQ
jgi:ketosteroid isomerase-like protein/predicted ester cyclase